MTLPPRPPMRRRPRHLPPPPPSRSSKHRIKHLVRRHDEFDPERAPTWRGSSGDLVVNPGGFRADVAWLVSEYHGKLRTDLSEDELTDAIVQAFKDQDTDDALSTANDLLEGHGVEELGPNSRPEYYYINFGDTYDATIMWSRRDDKVFVAKGGWGSVWEDEGEGNAQDEAWQSYLRREFSRDMRRALENHSDTPEGEAELERFNDLDVEAEKQLFDKALYDAQQESRGSRYPEWVMSSDGYSLMHMEVVVAKAVELVREGWEPGELTPNAAGWQEAFVRYFDNIDIGDRMLFKWISPDTGQVFLNFINLPRQVHAEGRGGGAEEMNNRISLVVTDWKPVGAYGRKTLPPGQVHVEPQVNSLGREYRLRAKTGSESSIAGYIATYLGRIAREVPPKLTHSR